MVKIKDKNHHLAIAIKENYSAGMKPKDNVGFIPSFKTKGKLLDSFTYKEEKKKNQIN